MQQDAEELWTQLVYLLKESLKGGGGPSGASGSAAPGAAGAGAAAASTGAVDDAFAIGTHTKLVCAETGASFRPPPPLFLQRAAGRQPRRRRRSSLTLALPLLSCATKQAGEAYEEASTNYMLKCNISGDVNYLAQARRRRRGGLEEVWRGF